MISLVLTEDDLGKLCQIFLDLWNISETSVLEKFKRWLNAPDPSTNHNSARDKHLPGTGQWLLQKKEYVKWKKQANSFMWINGDCELTPHVP
jgi:hypothetical protein